jgi:hypothetical protein
MGTRASRGGFGAAHPGRALASIALFAVIAAIAAPARAQAVTLTESGIRRNVPLHADPTARLWISRSDCLADDVLYFPLTLTNYAGYSLEVWAGNSADCTDDTQRSSAAALCWRMHAATPTAYQTTIPIRVQDLIAGRTPGAGTAADCNGATRFFSSPVQVTLYFMLMQGTSISGTTGVKWSTKYDLVGPARPIAVGAGADGTTITVTWISNADGDAAGHILLCDPPRGVVSAAGDAGLLPDGCSRQVQLVPGEVPSADTVARYQCGAAGAADTSFAIRGLFTRQPYAVAVASVDRVGNIGPLSPFACASTQETQADTDVLGRGGCSIGRATGTGRWALLAGALFALAILRARRRCDRA